jgi:hypothetical protein
MVHIYVFVIRGFMEQIVKFIIHVKHYLVLMVEHVYQPEIIHIGNVFVQHYIPVKNISSYEKQKCLNFFIN